MVNEEHFAQRDLLIRDIIAKMRPDGCGGRAGKGRWSCSPASSVARQLRAPAGRPSAQDRTDQRLK
jgi:hypothetical protein